MSPRTWLLVPLLALACGSSTEKSEEPHAAEEPALPIAGMYEVNGVTVSHESGHRREIAGTVILAESSSGSRYTATFNLSTTYPGATEALPAEVIGKGEGDIEGRTLRGTAETQLVMATVPGVDPGFAYIPRMVSTRIRSTTTATVATDGTVVIEIENQPAAGEKEYAPTRTTLRGQRVASAAIGSHTASAEP